MTVVVVRPAPACDELVQMLNASGINTLGAELLSFKPKGEPNRLKERLIKLAANSIVIAVSPRSVEYATQALEGYNWRADLHYVAVGEKTAKTWHELAKVQAITPVEESSEGLLALDIFQQVKAPDILILRGNGGRELLANKLKQFGAKICYFETYQRIWNKKKTLSSIKRWQQHKVKTFIITSGQQLEFLWASMDKAAQLWLSQCTVFVPSQRVQQQAKSLGFTNAINVDSAHNEALFNALIQYKILDNANDRDKQYR